MLKNRRAYGIIYIPSDFSDNIAKGKQTQVSIYLTEIFAAKR